MVEKKISLEKRELMAKRNLLTKAIERADVVMQFLKDLKEIAKDSGIAEDYLKDWVFGELKQVFNIGPTEMDEETDDVAEEDVEEEADEEDTAEEI